MEDDDRNPMKNSGRGKQPWFAPKRFGLGYRPQTWQGFLIMAIIILFILTLTGAVKQHGPSVYAVTLAPLIILAIVTLTRRR